MDRASGARREGVLGRPGGERGLREASERCPGGRRDDTAKRRKGRAGPRAGAAGAGVTWADAFQ